MNNINVNFEVENLTECFSIVKKKNIINIEDVEDNHRINFTFFEKKMKKKFSINFVITTLISIAKIAFTFL